MQLSGKFEEGHRLKAKNLTINKMELAYGELVVVT
jgi:hypothetical protein